MNVEKQRSAILACSKTRQHNSHVEGRYHIRLGCKVIPECKKKKKKEEIPQKIGKFLNIFATFLDELSFFFFFQRLFTWDVNKTNKAFQTVVGQENGSSHLFAISHKSAVATLWSARNV